LKKQWKEQNKVTFFMNQLKEKSVSKVGIIRNNEMEAVIIPIEEYEQLQIMAENRGKKSVKDYFGTMNEETYSVMEEALKDCRKVDANEW